MSVRRSPDTVRRGPERVQGRSAEGREGTVKVRKESRKGPERVHRVSREGPERVQGGSREGPDTVNRVRTSPDTVHRGPDWVQGRSREV